MGDDACKRCFNFLYLLTVFAARILSFSLMTRGSYEFFFAFAKVVKLNPVWEDLALELLLSNFLE